MGYDAASEGSETRKIGFTKQVKSIKVKAGFTCRDLAARFLRPTFSKHESFVLDLRKF